MDKHLEQWVGRIDKSLVEGINPEENVLEAAIHYSLSLKGKRLRPLIFLTLLQAYNKNPAEYLNIACAIEYIHTYSLIHDDLPAMDDDDLRRGMPTVHKKFNEAIALLAGDTLLTLAFQRIAATQIPNEKIVNIIKILTESIGKDGMAGGQVLDLEFNGKKDAIYNIHRKKTADLIKGTLLSAAEIIGMNGNQKNILEQAGISIGIAFQMADDMLDIEGDEKKVGKKLSKDKLNKSPNSIIYFGKDFVKKEIDNLYRKTLDLLKKIEINFPPFLYLMEKMVYRNK